MTAMSYIQSETTSPTNSEIPILPGPIGLTGNGSQSKIKTGLSGKLESSNQLMTETPPGSPTLTVPKGHRRNMSDTTAFNK